MFIFKWFTVLTVVNMMFNFLQKLINVKHSIFTPIAISEMFGFHFFWRNLHTLRNMDDSQCGQACRAVSMCLCLVGFLDVFSAYNNQPYQQMHAGIHRITSDTSISATSIDCPSQTALWQYYCSVKSTVKSCNCSSSILLLSLRGCPRMNWGVSFGQGYL